jgi:cyanate permease
MTAIASDRHPDGTAAGQHPYRWAILAGVWLVYFSFSLTIFAMAPMVHRISEELGLSHSAMGSVMGAWPLVYIAAAIPCGAFLDRVGAWRGLFIAALVMAASCALRGTASGHLSLFLAVALFGLGGPMLSTGAPKLIALWFIGSQRGLAMGIYFTGTALGGVTSLSLTNSVVLPLFDGNWRAVLFTYAAFVMCAGVAWFLIGAHPASRAMEQQARTGNQKSLRVFAELVRVRSVRIIVGMGLGILFFNHSLNNWLPEMLRSGGMDAVSAGYWASLPTLLAVCSSLLIPRLATPERRFAILGFLFVCAGVATFLVQAFQGPLLFIGLVLQGTARGAMTTVSVLTLMEDREVGPARTGSATGLYFSAAEIGGVLGPLSIGALADATGGFTAAFQLLAADCALLLLLLAALRRVSR